MIAMKAVTILVYTHF